jgi:hypothetical protein
MLRWRQTLLLALRQRLLKHVDVQSAARIGLSAGQLAGLLGWLCLAARKDGSRL